MMKQLFSLKESEAALFESQLKKLKSLDCPEGALEALRQKKPEVITQAGQIPGRISFIPVIPPNIIPLSIQMAMINYRPTGGQFSIPAYKVQDQIKTPDAPYFLMDVEIDQLPKLVNKRYAEVQDIFRTWNFKGLTVHEVIALKLHHPREFLWHDLLATGSKYTSNGEMQIITLESSEGHLKLKIRPLDFTAPALTSPFCRRRH